MDVEAVLSELLPQIPENVFSRWLYDRVSLTWLEEDDDPNFLEVLQNSQMPQVRRARPTAGPKRWWPSSLTHARGAAPPPIWRTHQ